VVGAQARHLCIQACGLAKITALMMGDGLIEENVC
jgi:hypothetical protein